MRADLINFETYFWGLSKDDITYTAELTKAYFKTYLTSIQLPSREFTPEIDLYLSSHIRETQFLLQFGIWRLQSIFETLLKSNFAIETRQGLRKIIKLLKEQGYYINEETELLRWTDLRNNLSHSAPERFHPAPSNLIESDLDEYASLLLNIYSNLEVQLNTKNSNNNA